MIAQPNRLLNAMLAQPGPNAGAPTSRNMRLLNALQGRRPGDAKYRSLAALQPYGESTFADRYGASGGLTGTDAFQSDAFQSDGFQV